MKFSKAWKAVMSGRAARRKGDPNSYVHLVAGGRLREGDRYDNANEYEDTDRPFRLDDLTADDWEILD